MGKLSVPTLFDAIRSTVMSFFRIVGDPKFATLSKIAPPQMIRSSTLHDPQALNCRVQLTKKEKDQAACDVFAVEICGSIHAPDDMHYTSVRVMITDVTDGISKAKRVQAQAEWWQMQGSPTFCYNAELGKLPHADTTLSDWMTVAELPLDRLLFPRKGKRILKFNTSIHSNQNGEELAWAECTFTYDNPAFGYIDSQENTERTRTLTVALAFAVSAADGKLFDCEVELIKDWAINNFALEQAGTKAKRKLDKALNTTVEFFCKGNELDTHKICKEVVEIAPVAERYEILALCLHVAQADGVASEEEVALLKDLANWLEVDVQRFRAMMQKILPISMHEGEDVESVLGITSDMSKDETRRHLNDEYRKWNSRVTNSDAEVKSQADRMLNFIAEARSQYVG